MRKLMLVLLILGLVAGAPVAAQDENEPDGWTTVHLRLRAGPGTEYATIGAVVPDTGFFFEAGMRLLRGC